MPCCPRRGRRPSWDTRPSSELRKKNAQFLLLVLLFPQARRGSTSHAIGSTISPSDSSTELRHLTPGSQAAPQHHFCYSSWRSVSAPAAPLVTFSSRLGSCRPPEVRPIRDLVWVRPVSLCHLDFQQPLGHPPPVFQTCGSTPAILWAR